MITPDDVRALAGVANEIRRVKLYLPVDATGTLKYTVDARKRALTQEEAIALAAAGFPTGGQGYTIITDNNSQEQPDRFWQLHDLKDNTWWIVQISRRTAGNALFNCIVTEKREAKAATTS